MPGARELLTSGRRLAVVTSCPEPLAHARLTTAELTTHDGADLPGAAAYIENLNELDRALAALGFG